jgi:RNA polymerase sigma-70 factor, ECF subfamily
LSLFVSARAFDTDNMTEGTGASFEDVVVPHLGAAYRLAQWLMRNTDDAEEVVQEASLRALRYFRTFAGGNGRAWFLTIVRNTCSGWRNPGPRGSTDPFDEEQHSDGRSSSDPETLLLQTDDVALVERALRNLPDRSRELLVLRELEGLSYRELAAELGIPIGTVMSGLSRAREALRRVLVRQPRSAYDAWSARANAVSSASFKSHTGIQATSPRSV